MTAIVDELERLERAAEVDLGMEPMPRVVAVGGEPAADSAKVNAEEARDRDGRIAFVDAQDGQSATTFEFCCGSFGSHASLEGPKVALDS